MSEVEQFQLIVPATILDARAATDTISNLCVRFSEEDLAMFSTALMEILVNVVKHSYRLADKAHMTVRVVFGKEAIKLVVEDVGCGMTTQQFDLAPHEVNFDPTSTVNLPEGGMGLAIVKSVMDGVQYEQVGGVNRLTAFRRWSS